MDGGACRLQSMGSLELETTERLHVHFSLFTFMHWRLQCSCLENPRNGGAWWASVYGVAQSRTRLKRLNNNNILFSRLLNIDKRSTSRLWKFYQAPLPQHTSWDNMETRLTKGNSLWKRCLWMGYIVSILSGAKVLKKNRFPSKIYCFVV